MQSLPAGLIALGAIVHTTCGQVDIALCDVQQVMRWGNVDGITAYSIGTTTVNAGDADLDWIQVGTSHPAIAQNMYRVLDGAIEHVGQGWVKHGFCALQIAGACAVGCEGEGGCLDHLGPGCQTSNSAASNGSHTVLGPRWQVNAHTGEFTYPYDQLGEPGDVVYKRIQVHDLDLGLEGAIYFVEGITVAPDDAASEAQDNNASYRMISIGPAPTFSIGFVPGQATEFTQPAIFVRVK